jgi:thymidine phosphorylase
MNQVLGDHCGNALEVLEAVAFLKGERQEPRLLEVTRMLSAELLQLGGLAVDLAQALQMVDAALASGQALERFARMVHALGGPPDFCERPVAYLARAPIQREVLAPRAGWICAMATRGIGLEVIALGGGRHLASDNVDSRVGFSQVVPLGQRVERGQLLARVHAADEPSADLAQSHLLKLIEIGEVPMAVAQVLMLERLA